MAGSFVPLPPLDVAASLGGALAVAAFALRLSAPGPLAGARTQQVSALRGGAACLAVIGAAGAFWLGGDALIVLFAVVSAIALADHFAHCSVVQRPWLVASCYAFVPLQFGLVAAGRADLFAVGLPLAATLAVPLLAIAQGETRQLAERSAERYWGLMVWVYFLSHVPALMLLETPGTGERTPGLVAFFVAIALATQWLGSRVPARAGRAAKLGAMLTVASALAALGAALAWMTPFTPTVAAAMALAIAFAGHLGCIVLAAQRRDQSPATRGAILARIVVRPDALAFAAPVFYHATRTWLTW